MTTVTLPLLGQVDFPANSDSRWNFEVQSPVGPVSIDFNVKNGQISESLLKKTESLLQNFASLDGAARAAIRADYAEGDGAPSYDFLDFHVEELPQDELDKCFGSHKSGSIGVEELLCALELKRVGFYLDDDEEFAIMDYMLKDAESDQILVVYVNPNGEILSVQMES